MADLSEEMQAVRQAFADAGLLGYVAYLDGPEPNPPPDACRAFLEVHHELVKGGKCGREYGNLGMCPQVAEHEGDCG